MKASKSGRSPLGAIAITSLALLAVGATVRGRKGGNEGDKLTEGHLKHGAAEHEVKEPVHFAQHVKSWLPVVLTGITLHSQIQHLLDRGAKSN